MGHYCNPGWLLFTSSGPGRGERTGTAFGVLCPLCSGVGQLAENFNFLMVDLRANIALGNLLLLMNILNKVYEAKVI